MNAASASGRSAQKTSWNRAGSIDTSTLPSANCAGRTSGPIASDGKRPCRSLTDSPSSGATPATLDEPGDLVRAAADRDHDAAIRVADEEDGTFDWVDDRRREEA